MIGGTVTLAYAAEGADQQIEEVVVTGSRIQRANLVSSSPVTQMDAEEITFSGITRLEDLVKNLPQVYSEQGTGQSNGATGTATLSLRNLGAERTLVLVNGRRLPPGSPLQDGEGADINQIPSNLVQRVEVLTGGASSTYGSDAVAGVVNFVMVDDFQGIQLDYQFSQYSHDNDSGRMRDMLTDAGYPIPRGTESDGDINNFSLIIGGNLEGGRGNVTAYATYRDVKGVTQAARDYSACALSTDATACAGSGTSPKGTFSDFGSLDEPYDFRVEGNEFVSPSDVYNYGPLNYWQRPDERVTAGAFAHYDITDTLEVYSELMFMDDRSISQIAPSGAFFVTSTISCGNPFLSQQQFDAVCGAYGLTEDDEQTMFIGRRSVEGGPRQQDLRHTTYRGVLGLRGDLTDAWSFDVYAQYAEVSMENTYLNDLSTTRIIRALDAVVDERTVIDEETGQEVPLNPDTFGQPVCQSVIDGSDPTCVPWNIFQEGAVTQEMIDYLVLPLYARGTTEQTVVSGYVTGDLTEQGIRLPTADSGVSVVLGLEYRKEKLTFSPDSGFQSGDGAGQGGPTLPVNGSYDVKEIFTEMSIPLVEGQPWAEALALDLGYRYSDYDTDQETDTYKVAASWTLNQDIKFRASYQRAVRAANLRELFLPQGLNLFDMNADPCGGDPEYTQEECARTGLPANLYGNSGLDSPANQFNYLQGGNTELEPEKSDTYSAGFVFTPTFIEGLTVSVDYFDIEVEDAISFLTPEFVLRQCAETGDPLFCDSVNRAPGTGSLWLGNQGYVAAANTNIGFFSTKGWDIVADYTFGIGDLGTLSIGNVMSIITEWDQQEVEGAPIESCKGKWGGSCGYPTTDFENAMRVTWDTPWDLRLNLAWRHIGAVDDTASSNVDLDSVNYFDLAGIWQPVDYAYVRLGINNLFDKQPPLAGGNAGPSNYGNGNTFPGIYDALGRYYFLGVTFDLARD